MRCLTICIPYPSLIMLPDDHPHKKRVENRTWQTSYRGPLLIHSGRNRQWEGTYDPAVEGLCPKSPGLGSRYLGRGAFCPNTRNRA